MSERKVPVQSLIDHIKTAVDVDPWAKEMAEGLLKKQEHSETFIVIDSKTGKEADPYYIEEDGTLLLVDECGRFAYADRERFKVIWDE